MSAEDNLKYLKDKRVLIATNGNITPGTMLLNSIKLYDDLIDENFLVCQAKRYINDKFSYCYGFQAFVEILLYGVNQVDLIDKNKKRYDYIIYIDEDCFIYDQDNLIELFKKFVDSDNIMAGCPDGGMFKTRGHNLISLNPFLSFYNLKYFQDFQNMIPKINKFNVSNILDLSLKFRNETNHYKNVLIKIKETKDFNNKRSEKLSKIYKNFTTNMTYEFDTYEPYYKLFLWIALNIKGDIMYFNAVDFYDECDTYGLTTACYSDNSYSKDKIVCLHTWYARLLSFDCIAYSKQMADRIKSIYNITKNKSIKEDF